jgi:hypothetical protein
MFIVQRVSDAADDRVMAVLVPIEVAMIFGHLCRCNGPASVAGIRDGSPFTTTEVRASLELLCRRGIAQHLDGDTYGLTEYGRTLRSACA